MKTIIQNHAGRLGFDDCRFTTAAPPESAAHYSRWLQARWHGEMAYLERTCQKRLDPRRVLPGANTILALAASYGCPRPTEAPDCAPAAASGQIARYACFEDYHKVLGSRLKELVALVNELGGPQTRSLWYVDTGPLLERALAQRAGLGFIGKHTNLISRKLGNWFFLAEIITTLPIPPDLPEPNHCGRCVRCIDACPTGAIRAPFQLDARRCISYLTIELKGPIPLELRPAIGNRIYGCDDCLAACPWNRFAREGGLMKARQRADLSTPGLLELLAINEEGFQRRFAGTPIGRVKRRGLLRNVCVALGNCADASALAALRRAAADAEPLIAEAASWAAAQIEARAKPCPEEEKRTNR